MAQRSQMYYCYFRFYIDEAEIITGMNKFCTGWENMFAVGYNYKEFKCFVDDLGGFEHWVGDMRGYISQTRETGFLDGAPSDSVFDQTMLMGTSRVIAKQVKHLAGFGVDAICYLRKITAKDAGTDHKVDFRAGAQQKITHPVMYTLDSTQIELFKITDDCLVDTSDVDEYEIMVDVNKGCNENTPSINAQPGVSISNVANMMDLDYSTYCRMTGVGSGAGVDYAIFDLGGEYNNFGIYGYNYVVGSNPSTRCYIYISNDLIGWTLVYDTNTIDGYFSLGKVNETYRYVKFYFYTGTIYPFKLDVYMLINSL